MVFIFDAINIGLVVAILLNLFLGVMVFFNGPKRKINIVYSLNIVAIISWLTAMFFYRSSPPAFNVLWCTMLYVAPTLIASSFLYFTYIFPSQKDKSLAIKCLIIFGINLFIIVMVLKPGFIIKEVNIRVGLEKQIIFTWNYIFYFIYTLSFFSFGFYRLFNKYRKSVGIERLQIIHLSIGYAIATNLAFVTNLLMPWMGYFWLNWLGQIFTVIMVAFTSYAITRYNLMNIKVVATEFFSGVLVAASIIPLFETKNIWEFSLRFVIFAITVFFSILIVRSVMKEVRRREEMEELNKKLNKVTKDLASANKELKRLDESKSEFLSISSHQLRTPLTIIKGYSSMLLEGSFGKMSKPVKESVDKIFVSTERLINLVESLLNISRIEAGRIEFNIEPVDLTEVAKSMVNDFQEKAKARKLKLAFMSEEKVPKVAADAQKIKDIVSNIIDNAIKYTKQGEIMVGLHQEGTSVVFCSQDTGIGMEADDIKRLFNKFTRGKDSNKVNTEGTGLGLYYARVLVENMGGRIWVESPGKNKGSKFCFSLPMADRKQAKKISG